VTTGETAVPVGTGTSKPSWWKPWAKRLAVLVVGLVALRVVVQMVGSVDWPRVAQAFGRLAWWMVGILLLALLLRQVLNAVPLALYVPGLGLSRSLQNDLSAGLVGTGAPPPADMVLRVAMFRSWGVDPVVGMTGVTLNMLTFYSVRFLAPVLGIGLIAVQGAERRQWVVAGLSGALSAAILVGLLLLLRGEGLAAWLGRSAGRLVRRLRRDTDPEKWAQALARISTTSAETLRAGLLRAVVALLGMLLADGLLLVLALRFLGVGAEALSVIDILSGFLLAYPLTLMPLFGFGVLDAALLAAWVTIAGTAQEPAVVAGLVVWRAVTILGPLAMGLIALVLWRRSQHRGAAATPLEETAPSP